MSSSGIFLQNSDDSYLYEWEYEIYTAHMSSFETHRSQTLSRFFRDVF